MKQVRKKILSNKKAAEILAEDDYTIGGYGTSLTLTTLAKVWSKLKANNYDRIFPIQIYSDIAKINDK